MIMQAGYPQRILMTADTVGGVWTYALELARALGAEGVEVALATMGGFATREQRDEAREIGTLELYESEYRLPWMDEPWEDVQRAGDWLLALASYVRADLIHLNDPVHGSVAWPAPSLAVAHSCVLSWWQNVLGCAAPDGWNRYREEMRAGLQQADEIVAPSAWMLNNVRTFYGVSRGRVIPNGRDGRELRAGEKAPLVFAAGRLWDPAKNLTALEAVAQGLTWPIYVAGEPSQPGRQESISADHLHLLGRLPAHSLAVWLRRASIYAFPARYEPFGLSVLEAALAGCTLVLGDVPPLRELWDGAAVFVSPDEPETLRLAIEGLIEDQDLRQALAMRAQRRAQALTPRRMALSYLAAYTDLLTSRKTGARESACAS
jgi:glycogen synthase